MRFPFSQELIASRPVQDDSLLTSIDDTRKRTVFVLVEAKTDLCNINGPWSNLADANVQRVICRFGCAEESLVGQIAWSPRCADSVLLARWYADSERTGPTLGSPLAVE